MIGINRYKNKKMIIYIIVLTIFYVMYKEFNPTIEDLMIRRNNRDFQSVYVINLWRSTAYYIDWETRCIDANEILPY